MSRYTVTWLKSAQGHLAQLWTEAGDRAALTEAANTIDQVLGTDPGPKGKAVSEGLYTLHVPPLHVLYSFSEADRIVEVASVRRDPQPSGQPDEAGNGQHPPQDS
jgi:hypothetical protein